MPCGFICMCIDYTDQKQIYIKALLIVSEWAGSVAERLMGKLEVARTTRLRSTNEFDYSH